MFFLIKVNFHESIWSKVYSIYEMGKCHLSYQQVICNTITLAPDVKYSCPRDVSCTPDQSRMYKCIWTTQNNGGKNTKST